MMQQPHEWPVRIYYEDTDMQGIVYYANYLKYLERARTEFLRSKGFEQDELIDEQGVVFAVRAVQMDYLKPAKFNDKLIVNSIYEIINPLLVVYNSLCKIKCKALADGSVLDLIRRAYAFGLNLAKLDIRQEASRHTDIISKIYKYKFKNKASVAKYVIW